MHVNNIIYLTAGNVIMSHVKIKLFNTIYYVKNKTLKYCKKKKLKKYVSSFGNGIHISFSIHKNHFYLLCYQNMRLAIGN